MSSPGCQRPVLAHISLVKDHTVLATSQCPNHKTRNRIKPFDGFERTHNKRASVLESLMILDPSRSSASMIANNSNIDSIVVALLEVDLICCDCENNGLLPLTLRVSGSPQSEPAGRATRRATKQEVTTTGQPSNAHYPLNSLMI